MRFIIKKEKLNKLNQMYLKIVLAAFFAYSAQAAPLEDARNLASQECVDAWTAYCNDIYNKGESQTVGTQNRIDACVAAAIEGSC